MNTDKFSVPTLDRTITDVEALFERADTTQPTAPLTSNELTALGVLALEAADRAARAGNDHAVQRYVAIARKCDRYAESSVRVIQ